MPSSPAAEPTGRQFRLSGTGGAVTATITEVGASLRALIVHGVDLVQRYPEGAPTPGASGIVLVPWPNRVRDGRWTQRGQTRQLALTEPALGNASHGLLRFGAYRAISEGPEESASLTLAATVFPQTGYPFHLDTTVTYALTDDGVSVTHTIRNAGAEEAPVALGTHPYLAIGATPAADLVVTATGATRFVVDERKLPVGHEPVDAATDLRGGRRLGDVELDTAYGDLDRGPDGLARTTLADPAGRTVTLWQDESFDYVQVFTSHTYPGHPLAVAVEPMTAPADALNSGVGVRWLAAGETWTLRWGLSLALR